MGVHKYDVCFSFASEQREYVENVYKTLKDLGISVFYDKAFEIDLWGENLIEVFSQIYKDAKYCVMFISKEYAEKAWTRFEKRNIIERAIQENNAYILPVRFDATEVPGLFNSSMYLDAANLLPHELANKIAEKLNKNSNLVHERNLNEEVNNMYISLCDEVIKTLKNYDSENINIEKENMFVTELIVQGELAYKFAIKKEAHKIYISNSLKDCVNPTYSLLIRLEEKNEIGCMDIINLGFLDKKSVHCSDVKISTIIADISEQLVEDLRISTNIKLLGVNDAK